MSLSPTFGTRQYRRLGLCYFLLISNLFTMITRQNEKSGSHHHLLHCFSWGTSSSVLYHNLIPKRRRGAPSCSSTSSYTVQESMRLPPPHSGIYGVMYLQRGPCPLGQASPYNWLSGWIPTALSCVTMCLFLLTAAQQNRLQATMRKCYGKNEWIGFCNICLLCSFRHLPQNGIVGSKVLILLFAEISY